MTHMPDREPRTITFGEIMLRLSPPGFERFLQSPSLVATFGGGEANVAASLAHFGCASYYVTRLPKHAIGDAAVRALRAEGVRTEHVVRGGDRVGIYFAENGASQRPSEVIYDRAGSSISMIVPGDVDWDTVMRGAAWFHCTGITPALGDGPAASTAAALEAARRAGARTSFDLNYRKRLWSQARAQQVVRPLLGHVDLLIANEEDLQTMLGVKVAQSDVTQGVLDVEGYRGAAAEVARTTGVPQVAITLRESLSASENGWSAILFDAGTCSFWRGQRYVIRIVDRIGGGDSFAAGLIYAHLAGKSPEDGLRFAVAASALKHTIPGDFNRVSVAEVERLAAGDESGRVQR
jgi:2-dehydro-3-deoxygluconokinase